MNIYYDYLNKKITRDEFYEKIPNNILNKVINQEINELSINTIFSQIDEISNDAKIQGIIGGPPCQAYSLAGRSRKKDMDNDPRNYLYLYYLEFIKKYKPDFFVFENVQGIISAKGGTIFSDIQKHMKDIGYTIDYKLLDSNDFGVIQHRKRIIIIGYKKELNKKYPNFKKYDKQYNIKDLFSDLPKLNAGEKNNNYIKKSTNCLKDLKIRDDEWNILTYNESRRLNENDKNIYEIYLQQENMKYNKLPEKLIKHNNTNCFLDRFKIVSYDKPSHTMVAHISKDGHHYIHPDIEQLRSITVREAARIQSFPDNYYFESSRTSAFKQIGNAVPVFMAEQIAKKIEETF